MSTIPANSPADTLRSPAGLRRALFLDERRQLLADQPEPSTEERQEAERRAEEWQRSMLVEGELFTERLRSSNLNRASFVELLARHAPETEADDGRAWRAILQEIMEDRHQDQGLFTRQTSNSSHGTTSRVTGSFRGFFEPILRTAAARLRAGLAELADRSEYGWVEFAQHRSCGTREEVERFFWRQGSYLALLHLLRAVDFHYENLIASGENPVLIDLEALFHQRLSRSDDRTARLVAQRRLNDSVVGIGMLPVLTWAPDGKAGADLSGIGARGGGELPYRSWMPIDPETDVMRLERQAVIMQEGRNRPKLGDREVDPAEFLDQIVGGFRETYDLMLANREHLAQVLEGGGSKTISWKTA